MTKSKICKTCGHRIGEHDRFSNQCQAEDWDNDKGEYIICHCKKFIPLEENNNPTEQNSESGMANHFSKLEGSKKTKEKTPASKNHIHNGSHYEVEPDTPCGLKFTETSGSPNNKTPAEIEIEKLERGCGKVNRNSNNKKYKCGLTKLNELTLNNKYVYLCHTCKVKLLGLKQGIELGRKEIIEKIERTYFKVEDTDYKTGWNRACEELIKQIEGEGQ